MENCIFCKIVAKQIPADVVHEDEDLLVFKDINPSAPVHLLITPKKHIACLDDAQDQDALLLGKMLTLVPKIAQRHG
jgi:histidine triad (HIT) family protein